MAEPRSSLGKRLLTVVGGGFGVLVVAALIGFSVLGGHVNNLRQGLELNSHLGELTTSFKTQVQEWKNVLLRGSDSEQRSKYWSQFNSEADAVQASGRELEKHLREFGLEEDAVLINQFLREHAEMRRKYQEGYAAFEAAGHDHRAGDKAVKGIDRAAG